MGFSLLGSEDIQIQVIPNEPWHSSLMVTRSLTVLNVVNMGSLVIVIVLLGIYVPAKLRKRFGLYPGRRVSPTQPVVEQVPTQPDSRRVVISASIEDSAEPNGEPRDRILYWYRLVVRLVQRITLVLVRQQQTLREFALEAASTLGPIAKYLLDFTRIVERLLYSRYEPAEEDVERAKKLSDDIERELKGEAK
jgi:hypothetical protein